MSQAESNILISVPSKDQTAAAPLGPANPQGETDSAAKGFLSTGIPAPNKESNVVKHPAISKLTPELLMQSYKCDCDKLSATELKEKYDPTYSSWKNMKQRAKQGAIIHQLFDDFRDFLSIVGPRLHEHYSLDRLNNDDPEYAPGKVEWRDKNAQNSNKGNNVYLTDDAGDTHTVSQWAAIKKTKATTIRKRRSNGWSHHEAIHGKKALTNPDDVLWKDKPWPVGKEETWELRYHDHIYKRSWCSRVTFLLDVSRRFYKDTLAREDALHSEIMRLEYGNDRPHWTEGWACSTANVPKDLILEFQQAHRDRMDRERLFVNAQAHFEHELRMKKILSKDSESHPATAKKNYLMLHPKPSRYMPVVPRQLAEEQFYEHQANPA